MELLLGRVKLCGPGLTEVVLPESDPLLRAALESRQRHVQKNVLTSKTMNEHRAAWAALGLRFMLGDDRIDPADAASPWYQSLCASKQARLQYHQHVRNMRLREARAAQPADLDLIRRCEAALALVDLHPSLTFMSTGMASLSGELVSPTVLPSCDLYMSVGAGSAVAHGRAVNRCLSGEELMMLNGWTTRNPVLQPRFEKRSNNFLANLAGNSFGTTIIAALVSSMAIAADMKEVERMVTSFDDAESVMQLFKRARLGGECRQ